MADLTIDIFDTSTTSEFNPVVTGWDVVIDDTTIPTESVGYYPDFVNVTEAVSLESRLYSDIVRAEVSVVFENVVVVGPVNVSVNDDVIVQDILQSYPDLTIVTDLVTEIDILNPFSPIMRDDIVTSESVSVSMNSAFGPFNPKKRISEITDPQIIRIERL